MRIAFLAWRDLAHPKSGGSEVVVDRWAEGLGKRGHDVTLLAGGPVGTRSYPVVETGGTYGQYLRAPVLGMTRLRGHDLLVDVSNGIPFFAPAWSRLPVLCVVHHVHREQWSDYFPRPLAAIGSFTEQRVVPRLYRRSHFVGVSQSTCDDLTGMGVRDDRIHLVENGLDGALLAPTGHARSETPLFLALGRVARNKRLDLLLEMWQAVREETGGRLVVAGDGPELASLRALGVPAVEFVGRVDEDRKRQLLAESWLLVHAAPREGWGLVIMEAAAVGTPALGFDVEGVRDTIVDGVTGRLATGVEDFTSSWRALAADAAERQRLGAAAAVRAQDFTWERTVQDFETAARCAVEQR